LPIHVLVFGGWDPCDWGEVSTLERKLAEGGLGQVHHFRCSQTQEAVTRCVTIHRRGPAAFVLVGWSAGANAARDTAWGLQPHGIRVARVFYLAANFLVRASRCHPDNVDKVIQIRAAWDVSPGIRIPGEQFFKLDGCGHYRLPSDPRTFGIVAREIRELLP
jgi:hypothetical protein